MSNNNIYFRKNASNQTIQTLIENYDHEDVVTDLVILAAEGHITNGTGEGMQVSDSATSVYLQTGSFNNIVVNSTETSSKSALHTFKPLSVLSTTVDVAVQVGDGVSSYDDLLRVDEAKIEAGVQLRGQDGTRTVPMYSFKNSTISGIYYDGNNVCASVNDNFCFRIQDNADEDFYFDICPQNNTTSTIASIYHSGKTAVKRKLIDVNAWNDGGGVGDMNAVSFYVNTQGAAGAENEASNLIMSFKDDVATGNVRTEMYYPLQLQSGDATTPTIKFN
jgi:hypothetical protein